MGEETAPLGAEKLELKSPLHLGHRVCCAYLVQGGVRGQLQGHWLNGAALSQDILKMPLETERDNGVPGQPFPPLPRLPSKPPPPALSRTHLLPQSPGRWRSQEGLQQLGPAHRAH